MTEADTERTGTHARLATYGRTLDPGPGGSTFPLILVVGREPSYTATHLVNTIGRYDFDAPRVQFWNVAYAKLAGVVGADWRELQRRCRDRRASPVLFGDALPITHRYGMPDVGRRRAAIPLEEIESHVEATFALYEGTERMAALWLAGHLAGARGPKQACLNLEHSNACYRRLADERQLPVLDTMALTWINSPRIDAALESAPLARQALECTLRAFDPAWPLTLKQVA